MNKEIAQWFQEGKFYEALSGEGEYFVMDHTYRSHHDLILVISTMIEWAFEANQVGVCTKSFIAALTRICIESPIKALDIISSYLIMSASLKLKLPVAFETFYTLLDHELKSDRIYSEGEKRQIESLMAAIGKEEAAFRQWKKTYFERTFAGKKKTGPHHKNKGNKKGKGVRS